jgi:hypothetical protein
MGCLRGGLVISEGRRLQICHPIILTYVKGIKMRIFDTVITPALRIAFLLIIFAVTAFVCDQNDSVQFYYVKKTI